MVSAAAYMVKVRIKLSQLPTKLKLKQMLLEESKLLLWKKWRQKKWRQKKGRNVKEMKRDDKETLEVKLKRIEKEVLEYEKELKR